MFYRESSSISHYENPLVEISELSEENLTEYELLQEMVGKNNRMLNSLVTDNIPLH
jgi:hypothetical protein